MATEDQEQQEQQSETTARFKLLGMKSSGERVDRVILEGSTSNPVRYIDLHGEADLTEEEAKRLRASGHDLRKVGDAEGDDNEADAPVAETKEQQQAAQAATAGAPESTGLPSAKSASRASKGR